METANNILEQRESQLVALGLTKRENNFHLKEIFVSQYQINFLRDADWEKFIDYVSKSVAELKEKQRQLTDKEKMNQFYEEIMRITGPELRSKEAQDVLKFALDGIHLLGAMLKEEVEGLQ